MEYIVVSDRNSKVLLSTEDWREAKKLAEQCRASGGEVTIFNSTKG